jgi:hypothetical protein
VPSVRCGAGVLLTLGLTLGGVVFTGCSSGSGAEAPKPKPGVPLQGSDPVAWTGAFCSGISEVISGASVLAKNTSTPQGQKDGVLEFTGIAQRAFTNTAQKLQQLGPPKITDGKRIQEEVMVYFTTAAGALGGQRAKFAALDANDPDFMNKAAHLAGPDLSAVSTQMRGVASNQELAPAFKAAPECKPLSSGSGPR